MLQNPCKTLGFKKNMVYKIPPRGEVNHIQPVALNALELTRIWQQAIVLLLKSIPVLILSEKCS